jgi:hypothetical protein
MEYDHNNASWARNRYEVRQIEKACYQHVHPYELDDNLSSSVAPADEPGVTDNNTEPVS